MGLHKGNTNNPAGRPRGRPNRTTADLRARIKSFLDDNWSLIERDFKKSKPMERLAFYEKLLRFAIPQMKESEITLSTDRLTENQVNQLLNEILKTQEPKTIYNEKA